MATTRKLTDISTLIIHCAATPNGRDNNASDVDFWHGADRVSRGKEPFQRQYDQIQNHARDLQHIGYHFVIAVDGSLQLGRHLTEVGAHCRGHNFNSVAICLMGTDNFSAEQWYTLRILTKGLMYELPNMLSIKGHTEFASYKTCPGFSVNDWLLNDMQPLVNHLLKRS